MLTEEQAKMFLITEEEAEVDKMVSEFDGVMMDENMMENDDLLDDEPGFNAEKIDAISQISPMNIQEDNTGNWEQKIWSKLMLRCSMYQKR
ncbi:hypothetical protein Bca4012_051071 [Brassica carinata]